MTISLIPGKHSVISITPAKGAAIFTDAKSDDTWSCPLIGWAIVYTDVEFGKTPDVGIYGTAVEPLILVANNMPMTLHMYREIRAKDVGELICVITLDDGTDHASHIECVPS